MKSDMFTLPDVQALVRDLSATNVLSVYLETRVTDPAMRDAWRPTLANALRDVGAGLSGDERPEFERARAVLEEAMPRLGGVWGAEGWVAFVTADGTYQAVDVPTHCPTLVAWREGPVIAPYMRVLKELRPVIVALVDLDSARIYRYAWGDLDMLPEMSLSADEHPAAGIAPGPERRGQSVPAPRSATGTERGQRRQEAAFESLAATLAERLAELADEEGWILVGGSREWARVAGEALPARLTGRVMVSDTLDHDATDAQITEAAQHAATALRAAHGQALLDSLLQDAGAPGLSASGVPSVQRALKRRAVDLLLLSPAFMHDEAEAAEDAVRATLLQGGDVEVLSGDAAARLDETAHGVVAKLRFALE
ncbi:MAG TPA: hypothetical protein VGE02_04745 [Gemmatimonadales bacterium]